MNIIHLREALQEMKKPEPFSITFVTCDENRKTGGDILKLDKVMLSTNSGKVIDFDFMPPQENVTLWSKAPNHYEHATRNVILPNGHRKKFHIRLLLEFNGEKVFY